MFKATHIVKENNGDHKFPVGAEVVFATEPKRRLYFEDETIEDGKWHYGTKRKYYVMEDEDGMQQSVLETEFEEIV